MDALDTPLHQNSLDAVARPAEDFLERRDAKKHARKKWAVIFSCMTGSLFEYYDFFLFGIFSPIFAKHFFPANAPMAGLLKTYGIFASAYLMRPLGGLFLGMIGDYLGRRRALVLAIWLMAIPTTLIGVLPTYEKIGLFAPVLLVFLRLLQGLSVGGELPNSMVLLHEYGTKQKGLMSCWADVGGTIGLLCSTLTISILGLYLTQTEIVDWGWRIPFWFAFVLACVGIYTRHRVSDPHCHQELVDTNAQRSYAKFLNAIKTNLSQILLVAFAGCANGVTYFFFFIFFPQNWVALPAWFFSSLIIILILSIPAFAWASDRINRFRLYQTALFVSILCMLALVWIDPVASPGLLYAVLVLMSISIGGNIGPRAALFAQSFELSTRATSCSVAYSVANVSGGFIPMVCLYLVNQTQSLLSVSLLVSAFCVFSMVCLERLKKRSGGQDSDLPPESDKNLDCFRANKHSPATKPHSILSQTL